MRKKIKKAFTLVELLVVIAILAILATVSIVGYNSFTKKAKVSNDTALVSQLNTLLKADSMVNGDAKTPTDALKITSEAGYDVEKLTPTTNDYEIIWNQAVNQFALLDEHDSVVYGEKSTEEYKNWKFVSEYNANSTYSMYLKNNTSINTINDLKVGLDVGTNTTITAVNYTNTETKDDVVIRTNGGTLTVDAASDTVAHYGFANLIDILNVSNEHCYHEYGNVLNVILKKGKLVLHNNSTINSLDLTKSTNNDFSVEVDEGNILVIKATNEQKSKIIGKNVPTQEAYIDDSIEAVVTNQLGNKIVYKGTLINSLNNVLESGQIVLLTKDVTSNEIKVNVDTTINFNSYNLIINTTNPYSLVSERKISLLNGKIEYSSARGIQANGFIEVNNMHINGLNDAIVDIAISAGANIINSNLECHGYVVSSFADNNQINITNSIINARSGDGCSFYHNGSYKGLKFNASSSTFNGQIYISASLTTAYQNAIFNNCIITGLSGIEVKYTNLTLNNCMVTATDTPSYSYNNNGSTTTGAAVVSTDNTMDGTPAPDGVITINGGEYIGLVGLKEIAGDNYPNMKEVIYIINDAIINGKIVNR